MLGQKLHKLDRGAEVNICQSEILNFLCVGEEQHPFQLCAYQVTRTNKLSSYCRQDCRGPKFVANSERGMEA
jgi:hypothetical protein